MYPIAVLVILQLLLQLKFKSDQCQGSQKTSGLDQDLNENVGVLAKAVLIKKLV